MTSTDAERQELERAVELLGKRTRSGRLLKFLGDKALQPQERPITEFDIATAVFGRSEKSFDATQDAVVRVEAHRLRKRLKEIYDKDDRVGALQISLPNGTYVPQFAPAPATLPILEPRREIADGAPETQVVRKAPWVWLVAIIATLSVILIAVGLSRRSPMAPASTSSATSATASPSTATPSEAVTEVHIMSGYSGSEVIDNSGVHWTPDRYFNGGVSSQRGSGYIRGTSRPFLFANSRNGQFTYDIPAAPGTYELRLHFISPLSPQEERLFGFNAWLNGQQLLEAFDPNVSANGTDVAEEQVFRDVRPGKDGLVRLWFANQLGTPSLSALELVPGIPGKLKPIRILTQQTSFVDRQGQKWRADDYFQGGIRSPAVGRKVSGTDDPELFAAERYGRFTYAIPVDRRSRYTVVLHFAEFYYGERSSSGGEGGRIFNVYCNGLALLRNFDIYREVGSLHVLTKRFSSIEPSPQGKINLLFEPIKNNATVSAIEILDESG